MLHKNRPTIVELPSCAYNFTNDTLLNEPSCSHLVQPWKSDSEQSNIYLTKQDFAECLDNLSLAFCSTEMHCNADMLLSCSLQLCLVAAKSNMLPATDKLDIYTVCFSAVFSNIEDSRYTAVQTVREWVRYCLAQKTNYQACLVEFTSLCFSAQLPITAEVCFTFLPILCGQFIKNNITLRKQCKADIDGAISAILVGQCSKPESQLICVSHSEIIGSCFLWHAH